MRTKLYCLFALLMVAGSGFGQVLALRDYHYFPEINANQILFNVLENDLIDGQPATAASVLVTPVDVPAGLTLLPNGILQGSSDDFYNEVQYLEYEICDLSNPNRCARAYASLCVRDHQNSAPYPHVITHVPDCDNPTATISFPDLMSMMDICWMRIAIGEPFGPSQVMDSFPGPVVFENVTPGIVRIELMDCDAIFNAAYDIYIPVPDCGLSVTKPETFVADAVEFYPNPFKDKLTISAANVLESVTIYDVFGKMVWHQAAAAQQMELEVSGWPSGLYLARTASGKTFKILKE